MSDRWMIRTNAYGNCNCATNCGCQFNLPSTHGFCQFVEGGHIEEGYFNDTSLSGLNWAFIMIWPGEIAEGNGKQLVIIDERADADHPPVGHGLHSSFLVCHLRKTSKERVIDCHFSLYIECDDEQESMYC